MRTPEQYADELLASELKKEPMLRLLVRGVLVAAFQTGLSATPGQYMTALELWAQAHAERHP